MFEKVIACDINYTVYYNCKEQRYFVDINKQIIHSYETIVGVIETLYYGGYIPTKEFTALNQIAA